MGFVVIVGFIFVLGFLGKRVTSRTYLAVAFVSLIAAYQIYYR
jgi:hypothetical protein